MPCLTLHVLDPQSTGSCPGSVVPCLPLQVWSLLLTRLQQGKTTKYIRCFIAFLSLMIALHGPAEIESQLNTMQPGLLLMLLQQIVLPQLTVGFFSNKQQKHVEVALIKVRTVCA